MPTVILKDVRLSYPDIWKPGLPPKDKPTEAGKYGCQGIFAPGSDADKVARAAFMQAATDKWGSQAPVVVPTLGRDKMCLRKGDANLDQANRVREGYAGMTYIVARNKLRPIVIGRGGPTDVLTEASGKPYGGCIVNIKVDIYAMDKPGQGKSINATLLAVQFVRDGEAFGSAPPDASGMDSIGDPDGGGVAGDTDDPFAEAPAAGGSLTGFGDLPF